MDAEERKRKLAALGGALGEGDAVVPGSSPDMVMKALALNPKLLENKDAKAVIAEVEKASQQRANPVAAADREDGAINKNSDLVQIVQAQSERIKSERIRIAAEEKRLQEEKKQLIAKALERVVDAVVTIDPNMVSPYTLMVLEDHKVFLRDIGFDVRKVQERRKSTR